MNVKILVFISYVLFQICPGFGQERTMVQVEDIKVPGVISDVGVYQLDPLLKKTTRIYMDGLNRVIQTVEMGASPQHHDLVSIARYDNMGQQSRAFLPYAENDASGAFRSDAENRQAAYYANGPGDKVADDSNPYSQRVFENSPLQRLLKEGSVGNGFQPGQHERSAAYRPNTAADDVALWYPDGSRHGSYAAGTLQVTEQSDEQGSKSLLFKDIGGRQVLKRQLANQTVNGAARPFFDTYYVYNETGQPSLIIPPKAVSAMQTASNWDLNQASLSPLLFRYVYDERGRLTEKTVPGAAALYIVYDPLERPVLLQDGKLRSTGQWNYIKYDARGRAISQGIYTDGAHTTRMSMQSYVNGLDYSSNYYEERSPSSAAGYYTNAVFPTASIEPLAYSYYDDYDLNQDGSADYTYQGQGLSGEATATARTRGLLTAVQKRTTGSGLGNIWLLSIQFYDKWGNVIQVRSNNQLNTGLNDSKTLVPDFTGKPLQVKTVRAGSSGSTAVLSSYSYDHAGRLQGIDDSYNGAVSVRIATYEYNELGQLTDRKLHSTNGGGSYLQSVDYRYSIRGQLLSINNSTLTADEKNDESNDVFGMEVLYNQTDNGLGNTGYYNGQVSAVKWMSKDPQNNTPKERGYHFEYDQLLRLKNALYHERPAGGSWGNSGAWDEKNMSYDENGNILGLQRNAYISGSITVMDNLSYSYDGNRLNNISDGGSSTLGFKNLTGSPGTYSYNENGSLSADPKKGLSLSYNVMGRVEKATIVSAAGRYLTYTYDATGILLRKQQYDNNVLQKTTDYIDGFVYENGVLSYFGMAEGRVRNTGGSLKPEYMVRDYQGNVRVSFEERNGQAVVRQENSYYPYGLVMPGGTLPTQPNRNLYNGGSEWQNDYGDLPDYYSTYYRNYDAATGRFTGIDPEAEGTDELSPYQYAGNNPVLFNDPLGNTSQKLTFKDVYGYGSSDGGGFFSASYQSPMYDNPLFDSGTALNAGGGGWGFLAPMWNLTELGENSSYNLTTGEFRVYDINGSLKQGYPLYGTFWQFPSFVENGQIKAGGSYFFEGQPVVTSTKTNANSAGGWLDKAGTAFSVAGLGGDLASLQNGSFRLTNGIKGGFSPKYYASGWTGGSPARINTYSISKVGGGISAAAGAITTGISYYQIANGNKQPATYVDAGVGTIGVIASGTSYFAGVEIPYVGEGVAVYGGLRLTWDVFFDLGVRYGPSKWYGQDDTKYFK